MVCGDGAGGGWRDGEVCGGGGGAKKHVARNMLAPSAVAFMQHIPYARVRIHSGAFSCLIGNSEEFPIKQEKPAAFAAGSV